MIFHGYSISLISGLVYKLIVLPYIYDVILCTFTHNIHLAFGNAKVESTEGLVYLRGFLLMAAGSDHFLSESR